MSKIEVTESQYHRIKKLTQPGKYEDYKAILGERRALQIMTESFHDQKVTIVVKQKKKGART